MSPTFFDVDDHDLELLKAQWNDLSSFYTADQEIKDRMFQILAVRYSEQGRFYHNLSHVKALLVLFDSLREKFRAHDPVRFSIWLHDAVYDPKRNDNEEESAKLAAEVLGKLNVEMKTIDRVTGLILATKSHSGANLSEDARLFLDMDLAILGSDELTYKEYAKAIRAEYSWVSEPAYRQGRQRVLKGFIERDSIYFSAEMQTHFEEQARKNIQGEIEMLGSMSPLESQVL